MFKFIYFIHIIYFIICSIYLSNFVLFRGTLLDNSSTEIAPAKEPKNKESICWDFNLISKEIIDNIVSPAPTLSTTLDVNAGL